MTETIDLQRTTYNDSKPEEWKALIVAMNSGKKVLINESVYYYFLEVLPPVQMFKGGFYFAEGAESLKRFSRTVEGYQVKQLNIINPSWTGVPCKVNLEALYRAGKLGSVGG